MAKLTTCPDCGGNGRMLDEEYQHLCSKCGGNGEFYDNGEPLRGEYKAALAKEFDDDAKEARRKTARAARKSSPRKETAAAAS